MMKDVTKSLLMTAEAYGERSSCESWDRKKFYTEEVKSIYRRENGGGKEKLPVAVFQGTELVERSMVFFKDACEITDYYGEHFRLTLKPVKVRDRTGLIIFLCAPLQKKG